MFEFLAVPGVDNVLLLAIIIGGIMIQSFAGFGFGLIAMPLFIVIGLPIVKANYIIVFMALLINLVGVGNNLKNLPRPMTEIGVLSRAIGVPFGLLMLTYLSSMNPEKLKVILGYLILVAVASKFIKSSGRPFMKTKLSCAIFMFMSGVINGAVSMGGPPMVYWSLEQDWDRKTTKSFLMGVQMFTLIPQVMFYYFAFKDDVAAVLPMLLALIPVVVCIYMTLNKVSANLSKDGFMKVCYSILTLMALNSIIGGVNF